MLNAIDQCANCGQEFAEHNYVPDSIDQYRCPYPRIESSYGHFTGGDPRQFYPDGECCSEGEIENHKKACELWNECESRGETLEPEKCPSGWAYDDNGQAVAHVLRASYGIGVQTHEEEQFFEPREHDYETEETDDA